jgi:hypothetical protein
MAMARNLAAPVAIALLAAMLSILAFRSDRQDSLPAAIRVVSTEDPLQTGSTMRATVEVVNQGSREMRPRFSVTWLPYPYYWTIVKGPAILEAGEQATYVIQAPDATSAPRNGQAFNVRVNDGRSITYAISDAQQVAKGDIVVGNPEMAGWSQSSPSTGLSQPAGWSLYKRPGAGDTARIEPANVFGVAATYFSVTQDGLADEGGWSHAGLTQVIPFPEQPLEITVLSRAPFQTVDGGWPLTGFGLEVDDPRNGLAWILFQPTGNGDQEYDLSSGHHILVMDVPYGTWATRTIDLAAMYERVGWAPAGDITIKLFAAASSRQANSVEGYIQRIGPSR